MSLRRVVSSPPASPLMVYDGECGFCRFWIARWKSKTGDRIAYASYQESAPRFPEIPREDFERAVQLLLPSGEVFGGAEAVLRALALGGRAPLLFWMYRRVPGFGAVSEIAYRFIARRRAALFRITRFFARG